MHRTIDAAMADPNLLGAALGDIASWHIWRTVLKATFALPLDEIEAEVFAAVAGGRRAPVGRVSELWAIAGRRSGKSRVAAALAVYAAAFEDHRAKLAPGETGHVLVLAPSRLQARTVRDYVEGFFTASPILAPMVEAVTADEIRLKGNIVISVHTNNFRTVRGRTLLCCIFDESAYWRDETSASPDLEVYRAVLPALASTTGLLIGISSPYRRVGLLHQKHRDHFGQDGDVLVIQAPTTTLNPTIDARIIERARRDDPEAALAEWDAEFRSDLAALLDDAVIDAAIEHGRPLELPPRAGVTYLAFTDASAGRHDSFTLGIGHVEDERFVADVIRGRRAPFDPNDVANEFAALAKDYGCSTVTGDNFAGEWVSQAFKAAGMGYKRADLPKSGLYLEMLPHFMRGAVSIPDHPVLVRELRLLERRTARSGRDSVDHPKNGSDDFANALAGSLWLATKPRFEPAVPVFGVYGRSAESISLPPGWSQNEAGNKLTFRGLDYLQAKGLRQ